MVVLGIDTSESTGGLALVSEEVVIAECVFDVRRTYSDRVMVALDFMLRQSGLSLSDMNGIAVSQGPGSYTGLRIGVTVAKTLCYCLRIPLAGVSTLRAIAQAVAGQYVTAVPAMDARQDRVYASAYAFGLGDADCLEVMSPSLVTIDELRQRVSELSGNLCFLGSGALRHSQELRSIAPERCSVADATRSLCRPSSVALLGMEKLRSGETEDVFDFAPEYLRPSAAEVRLIERSREVGAIDGEDG
jgi:tRNA threonylcarbamoyladenosine biosynthesis protein TsaB